MGPLSTFSKTKENIQMTSELDKLLNRNKHALMNGLTKYKQILGGCEGKHT